MRLINQLQFLRLLTREYKDVGIRPSRRYAVARISTFARAVPELVLVAPFCQALGVRNILGTKVSSHHSHTSRKQHTHLPSLLKPSTTHPIRTRRLNRVDNQPKHPLPHVLPLDHEPIRHRRPLVRTTGLLADERRAPKLDGVSVIGEVMKARDDVLSVSRRTAQHTPRARNSPIDFTPLPTSTHLGEYPLTLSMSSSGHPRAAYCSRSILIFHSSSRALVACGIQSSLLSVRKMGAALTW